MTQYHYQYDYSTRHKLMDFRGFDSNIILIERSGTPNPIGNLTESLSQAILVGVMSVGRLGVVGVHTGMLK